MFHYCFAVFSPVSMSLLLMVVASEHWSVFEMTLGDSPFPVPVLVVLCGESIEAAGHSLECSQ